MNGCEEPVEFDGITSSHIQDTRAGKGFRTVTIKSFQVRVRYPLPAAMMAHLNQMKHAGYPPDEMFLFLSKLCLDDPWNTPALWKRLFDEVNNSSEIVRKIAEVYT